MIINTGARTDTVQYYTDWLLRRFEEGYVLVRNPLFPNKVTRYELDPAVVDCVVFCSKDYRPILPRLSEITGRFNTYFHYTITAYGPDIEPGVPSIERSIETLVELARLVGTQRVAWRYDPVLLTGEHTVERHLETFERMAQRLAPHIDRCIFSFVEMYKKLAWNMPELVPLSEGDRDRIAQGLGAIAGRHGIRIQTCGTNGDFTRYGIAASGCMTLDILGGPTASSSNGSSTAVCAKAATASRAATSVRTTPAPTAADTATPTRTIARRPRTTAATTPRRPCSSATCGRRTR